ncbi:hypothetical protein H2202_008633 [Exophiala xenobiotica]|nr:hypothetical protein H2202_008633 [Exophiala xenobiotica]KAK5203586.1 hypothetical protein LTR41_010719 [Exophiala xenobiotica]KAK5228892.1 hypothetical protein LTR47_008307 [Exophiala xenobiotica]KAK5243607.1 hypothetical protein LTS06_010676 [Exophiala xenobiotica]KAK5316065.1 hypothetical protein LTR93_009393 [Exophiala xenobiotica]
MEALIYDESPIAEYLEADAIPFEIADLPSTPPRTFAPRGLPKLRERLRAFRQTAASVTDVANEKFLERFRYTIVASQLLQDDPKPWRHLQDDEQAFQTNAFSTRGALMTAGFSFSIAWFLHFLRRRHETQQALGLYEICIYMLLVSGGFILLVYFARRQYLESIRRSAGSTLGRVIAESHNLDTVTTAGLRFIQEVEVVSRGYEISPMPPISRLEDQSANSRCRELRAMIGMALTASISQSVEAHNAIQPSIRQLESKSYHDIYDVSMQDYTDAVTFANNISMDAQDSLKELRFLFRLHLMARKVFFCDLLALHSGSTWYNICQWRGTLHLLQDLEATTSRGARDVRAAVVREEFGGTSQATMALEADCVVETNPELMTPQRRHTKAQIRRFDAVANSIRSLNAKVHLVREAMNSSSTNEDDPAFSMTITRGYETLGAEIRNALSEWEKGRNTMFLHMDADPERRSSRASSDIRSPASPSPSSLGGMTIVDGGPAEAFKLLSGDERASSDGGGLDEEVFEAVAMPRKRMSWTPMSREEKLSRLQQERIKRATVQEHAENTTNMLRELQMVIKHRPNHARPETRITSI